MSMRVRARVRVRVTARIRVRARVRVRVRVRVRCAPWAAAMLSMEHSGSCQPNCCASCSGLAWSAEC